MTDNEDLCLRGHPRTPENTRIDPKTGKKRCVLCQRIRSREKYDRDLRSLQVTPRVTK